MTTINPITASSPASAAAKTGSGTNITADFSTFLTLLTTQLRNQDPMNPMNSTEFATQLATFSGVEQQVRTNEMLESILAQTGVSTLSQLGSWVGMEVLTDVPAQFSGSPIALQGQAAPGADQATLVVRDSSGAETQRLAVTLPVSELTWAGVMVDGAPLPVGAYRFELESLRQGAVIATTPLMHYAHVEEARSGEAGVMLQLAGGGMTEAASVKGLRHPRI